MSITDAVARMYEKYPYPNYPLLAKPQWQEGYLVSSQFCGRLLLDNTGCAPSVNSIRGRQESVSILLAGSGEILPYIMRKWEPSRHSILSLDLSSNSLKRARFRSAFKSKMSFIRADIESFLTSNRNADTQYDHIDSYGVVHHLDKPAKVLGAFSHKIHPNGTIRLMVYNGQARKWIHEIQEAFKVLELSHFKKSHLSLARQILSGLAKNSTVMRQRLSSMQSTLANDARLVDTFFHQREVPYKIEEWMRLIEDSGLEIISLFDRYGELDDLANPMWQPPTKDQLKERADDMRFENNLEVILASRDRCRGIHNQTQRARPPLFQYFKSPPKLWFSFDETKNISNRVRRNIWKKHIEATFTNNKAIIDTAGISLPALKRLARVGAIFPSQVLDKEFREYLLNPICDQMEAPVLDRSVEISSEIVSGILEESMSSKEELSMLNVESAICLLLKACKK